MYQDFEDVIQKAKEQAEKLADADSQKIRSTIATLEEFILSHQEGSCNT